VIASSLLAATNFTGNSELAQACWWDICLSTPINNAAEH